MEIYVEHISKYILGKSVEQLTDDDDDERTTDKS